MAFLFRHFECLPVDSEGVGVVADEHAAHSQGFENIDHPDSLAFMIVSVVLVLIDLYDDVVRRGIVKEIGPVFSALASDGLIVNGVIEVRCGFEEFLDGHLAGFLALRWIAVRAQVGFSFDDEESA